MTTGAALAGWSCQEPTSAPISIALQIPDNVLLVDDTSRIGLYALGGQKAGISPTEVTWSTSDSSVAIVDETGLLTAVNTGEASITAIYGSTGASLSIRVTRVLITSRHPSLLETTTQQLDIVDRRDPASGPIRPQWSSSRPDIVVVDSAGTITGTGVGTADVIVTTETEFDVVPITVLPAVVIAAGDIGDCSSGADEATGRIIDTIPGTVLALGDIAYPDGRAEDFANCYDPAWGRHRPRTRPVPGNHEYNTPGAQPYFDYFGASAGDRGLGYYSFDLGPWHLVALNTSLPAALQPQQEAWLTADLAADSALCTLVYMHFPLFSSGQYAVTQVRPLWRIMYAAGVDVVLAGHDHLYERFAPQDPDGNADPAAGIRQFTVGTGGGHELFAFVDSSGVPNSELRRNDRYGVLVLTLRPDHYDWRFASTSQDYVDAGSGNCH